MPRNVRNFWLELSVDGKRSKVATGPIRKDGGFDLTILVRNRGSIDNALYVSGRADEHGNLEINVHPRMAAIDDQYTKGFTIPSQR